MTSPPPPRPPPPRTPTEADQLACIVIMDMDVNSTYLHVSASMLDILGYHPDELIGTSPWRLFHPDEMDQFEEIRYQNLLNDKVACVAYCQMLHKTEGYIPAVLAYNVVFDKMVGSVSRATPGPRALLRAATAQEVVEVTSSAAQSFQLRKTWFFSTTSPPPTAPLTIRPSTPSTRIPLKDIPEPSRRTFLLLDRFSKGAGVIYVSNGEIVDVGEMTDQSFYDFVAPENREEIRRCIEEAKTTVGEDRLGASGYTYLDFGIRRGNKIIQVEGILSTYSDGLLCVFQPSGTSASASARHSPVAEREGSAVSVGGG